MSVEDTLRERGSRYGEFKDVAETSQRLQNIMQDTPNWIALRSSQREALQMACSKFARILHGDPNYADNWHDVAGYAKLVDDELTGEVETPEYTLEQAIGFWSVSDWSKFVVITKRGTVIECDRKPELSTDSGHWVFQGKYSAIVNVKPPLDFTKCIWEVNKK